MKDRNQNGESVGSPYKKNWFSDEQFWVNYGPLMFHSQSWENAYFEIQNVIKLLNLKPGTPVLDSCCGVGRHSFELAQAGMKVTGVDLSQAYIEAAVETAQEQELEVEFVRADVREYCEENRFEAVVNLYTSYGYFETDEDERKYLKNVLDSLKPGGVFLIDTISKEALSRDFIEDEWFEEEGKIVCLEYSIIEDFSRLVNRWMIVEPDGKKVDYTFSHKIFSGIELKLRLLEAGFSSVKLYGSLEGIPYDHKVKRLVAVAKKG